MAERQSDGAELTRLLDHIRLTRGFDFTGYKRTTLIRRITKRMQDVGCETLSDYVDYLEVHPNEFTQFFNTILINVTSFFRDAQAWEYMTDEIVPRIVSGKPPGTPIRIWSAGCATGQEAYSLAITLAEALGPEQFRDRVKIYGTDVDDDALTRARQAYYTVKEVESVPADVLDRYFDESNGGYAFSKDLRRSVIFGRHDLVRDAPISRLDLLVCRNTLMYFNAETQAVILDRFRFALNGAGYLFLGKAETLLTKSETFRALDLKLRIFSSVNSAPRPRTPSMRDPDPPAIDGPPLSLRDSALLEGRLPLVLVDVNGTVALINVAARQLFGIGETDVGLPLQDLELSYRPVELRSILEQCYAQRQIVERKDIPWERTPGRAQLFDVVVTPLFDIVNGPESAVIGASITYAEVTQYQKLQEELEHSTRELETAYEELQSTNEELETTNEELQSTIEELETTNEELQSTNEELETMNEELQSTNDELQSVNEELQERGDQLDEANVYLQSILGGLGRGVVVCDREMTVRLWNHWSEDLWGLRPEEVEGRHFINLDIGLPVERLLPAIRECLETGAEQHMATEARNRRGRDFLCAVTATVLGQPDAPIGVIVLMEEQTDTDE
jgi:two-component system CheB/CheR fusion protein